MAILTNQQAPEILLSISSLLGFVPFTLTNVSLESAVLVSSGVSPNSHNLVSDPGCPFMLCPTLESKKHSVRLDVEANKS